MPTAYNAMNVKEPESEMAYDSVVRPKSHRFPHCVVWTPIPLISWMFPLIGHMGIATSNGVIRDFAGSYFVAEDDMGFGWPTRYWQLPLEKVPGGRDAWDRGVRDASDEYHGRAHNLFCDNCHSHAAMALNSMQYNGSSSWNMVKLCFWVWIKGRYTGFLGWVKQWIPFLIVLSILITIFVVVPRISQKAPF